ncbi:hypothetical protein HOC35_06045 [Candidatus Woesearchaeota archaeon]|jgi:hypothetical protein|nr:hypothetical protein [Candidatus Woesearchaeota archaeon]
MKNIATTKTTKRQYHYSKITIPTHISIYISFHYLNKMIKNIITTISSLAILSTTAVDVNAQENPRLKPESTKIEDTAIPVISDRATDNKGDIQIKTNTLSRRNPVNRSNNSVSSIDYDNIRQAQKDNNQLIKPITLQKGWNLDIMLEFMIIPKLMECDALEERLDVTRDDFAPSMGEEFGDQLQISPMFGSLGLVTRLTSPWGFTNRDHVTFLLSAHYASSSYLGKITSKKDYNATLLDGVIELGKTTALWEQNLNHHFAILAGVGYDWDLVRKPNFKLGAELSARGGLAYMEFSTLLDLFVHDTTQFEKFTYEVAAAIDVYKHRFTESEGNAWGGIGRFEGTLQFKIWKGIALDLGGGFQVEGYQEFHMNVTEYSGGFPDQKVKDYLVRENPINDRDDVGDIDNNINPMTRNGWYAFVRLGYTFSGLFGEKEIETNKGPSTLLVPIKYLNSTTNTSTTRLLK